MKRWGCCGKEIKDSGDPSQLGDDIPFAVVGSTAARLWQPDIRLLKYTKRAHTLLARDGTRPVRIIESVRVPAGERDDRLRLCCLLDRRRTCVSGSAPMRCAARLGSTR